VNTRGTAAAVTAPLGGRDPVLTELRDFVGRAAGGDSGAVILTGLPGVGKTALARAALDLAARAGFATFAGRARPLSHDVAYAPLAEAFGPPLRALGAHDRERTLRDLDPLALVLAGTALAVPAPLRDPALERSRLADAFTRLAERLAGGHPLALLVDDVNAVDDASAFVLLAPALRSVLLPLTALVVNFASVAAAFGIMVLIWQKGFGNHAIWGVDATGTITFWVPVFVFAFVFGLSMDYEVFILSGSARSTTRPVRRTRPSSPGWPGPGGWSAARLRSWSSRS